MRAVRVLKAGKGMRGLTATHVLTFDRLRTLCGLKVAALNVQAEIELNRVPGLDGCRACQRAIDRPQKTSSPRANRGPILQSSRGRAKLDENPVWHDLV